VGSFPRFTSTYHYVATQMRLPLAFVGGKPGNPALMTAYDTVSYLSTIILLLTYPPCYFFPLLIFSPSTPTSSPIYNNRDLPLVVLLTRPYQRARAAGRLRSTVLRYSRPVYVRTLYFVQRYLPGLTLRLRPADKTIDHPASLGHYYRRQTTHPTRPHAPSTFYILFIVCQV
jgi:hypothetical protein